MHLTKATNYDYWSVDYEGNYLFGREKLDWKIQFFTKEVFKYLSYNIDEIKQELLSKIEKCFVEETQMGYSPKDLSKVERDIEKLNKRYNKLLDMLENDIISNEQYVERRKKVDEEMLTSLALKEKLSAMQFSTKAKEDTIEAVKKFFDEKITLPMQKGDIIPEEMIETYVNSIKACANNVFEFDMCINPLANNISPLVVPEEEYIPSIHSAKKIMDNSDATLIAEFTLGYDDAKAYANRMRRKVKRVHWENPAVIRIYARL